MSNQSKNTWQTIAAVFLINWKYIIESYKPYNLNIFLTRYTFNLILCLLKTIEYFTGIDKKALFLDFIVISTVVILLRFVVAPSLRISHRHFDITLLNNILKSS